MTYHPYEDEDMPVALTEDGEQDRPHSCLVDICSDERDPYGHCSMHADYEPDDEDDW
jgi:hypothetical protein